MPCKPGPLPAQPLLRTMFDYDPDTGRLSWRSVPWRLVQHNARWAGRTAGELHPNGYLVVRTQGRRYLVHRLIWKLVYGDEPEILDHINRNGADNRLANLRACTHQENMRNTDGWSAKSLPKGVHLRPESGRFRAIICVDRKNRSLGTFDSIAEAASAYAAAARRLHGEFARAHGDGR